VVIAVATVLGLIFAPLVVTGDAGAIRDAVLKIAGGVLLVTAESLSPDQV
jgi:hypothetical protein